MVQPKQLPPAPRMDQPSLPKNGTPASRGGRIQRFRREELDGSRTRGSDELVIVAGVPGGFDWVGGW